MYVLWSSWVVLTPLKKYARQIGSSSPNRSEKKNLWNHSPRWGHDFPEIFPNFTQISLKLRDFPYIKPPSDIWPSGQFVSLAVPTVPFTPFAPWSCYQQLPMLRKNSGKHPKMDGEKNGKPLLKSLKWMMGGVTVPIFGNIHIIKKTLSPPTKSTHL